MTVAQWDIFTAKVWDKDHPVVVLTPSGLCRQAFLNVLGCSTLYAARQADPRHEMILDEATVWSVARCASCRRSRSLRRVTSTSDGAGSVRNARDRWARN